MKDDRNKQNKHAAGSSGRPTRLHLSAVWTPLGDEDRRWLTGEVTGENPWGAGTVCILTWVWVRGRRTHRWQFMSWTLQTCAFYKSTKAYISNVHTLCMLNLNSKNKLKCPCEVFFKGPVNKPPYLMINNLFSWNVSSNAITRRLQTRMRVQFRDYKTLQEVTWAIFFWEPSPIW